MDKYIREALFKAQERVNGVEKKASNPHYKSKYSSLDDVYHAFKKELLKEKVIITHDMECKDGAYWLLTTLLHETGVSYTTKFPMILEAQKCQALGSARTYACRYSLYNLFAVSEPSEDDDGNKADGIAKSAPKKEAPKKQVEGVTSDHIAHLNRVLKDYDDASARMSKAMKLYDIKNVKDLPLPRFNEFVRAIRKGA